MLLLAPMNDHLKGLMITALGVLLIVPDSLFVRLIEAEPLVIAFWRGMTAGLTIFAAVLVFQGPRGFAGVLRSGWPGGLYVFLIGSTTLGFVLAVSWTSVANVVFIFASIPIFATIFSRIFLGEPVRARMVLTMGVVLAGLAIIAYGSGSSQVASWQGDLLAVYVSAAYAGALTVLRKIRDISMIPAIPVAYVGAALLIWLFRAPLPAFEQHWPLFLAHGAFIGAATCFLTLGPRFISAPEVSLLILLESVLAPLLVWAVIGEDPGQWALLGGAVVIGALVVSNLWAIGAYKSRRARGVRGAE